MARYVATIPSLMTPDAAFLYMADLRNFAKWDKGVKKVVQVKGNGGGKETEFDVTAQGFRGRDLTFRYRTVEHDAPRNILVKARNSMFSSVDRVTIVPTASGCDVTYDATLTLNGIFRPMSPLLGPKFKKIGDVATNGLKRVLADPTGTLQV